MSEANSRWGGYVKPALWELMHALRIDVKFHSASGDYLYYKDGGGKEIGVLDFCGGMGSTLLGHNNPEINRERMACIIDICISNAIYLSNPKEVAQDAPKWNGKSA